jgi:hypothetical protein
MPVDRCRLTDEVESQRRHRVHRAGRTSSLAHKHPDDRGRVAATIDQILNDQQAFGTHHRIVDTRGGCARSSSSGISSATTPAR